MASEEGFVGLDNDGNLAVRAPNDQKVVVDGTLQVGDEQNVAEAIRMLREEVSLLRAEVAKIPGLNAQIDALKAKPRALGLNLLNNPLFNGFRNESVGYIGPAQRDCQNTSLAMTEHHPYSYCFESPYAEFPADPGPPTCNEANETHSFDFGSRFNSGPRFSGIGNTPFTFQLMRLYGTQSAMDRIQLNPNAQHLTPTEQVFPGVSFDHSSCGFEGMFFSYRTDVLYSTGNWLRLRFYAKNLGTGSLGFVAGMHGNCLVRPPAPCSILIDTSQIPEDEHGWFFVDTAVPVARVRNIGSSTRLIPINLDSGDFGGEFEFVIALPHVSLLDVEAGWMWQPSA